MVILGFTQVKMSMKMLCIFETSGLGMYTHQWVTLRHSREKFMFILMVSIGECTTCSKELKKNGALKGLEETKKNGKVSALWPGIK